MPAAGSGAVDGALQPPQSVSSSPPSELNEARIEERLRFSSGTSESAAGASSAPEIPREPWSYMAAAAFRMHASFNGRPLIPPEYYDGPFPYPRPGAHT